MQLLKINSSTGNQSSNTLFIFQDNVLQEQCEVAATGYFFIVSVILRNLVQFKVERITEIPNSTYFFKLKLTDTIAMSMVKFHYCYCEQVILHVVLLINPANIYLFKVNNRNTRRRSGVFIVTFEHISHPFFSVSIVDIEQVNVSWE